MIKKFNQFKNLKKKLKNMESITIHIKKNKFKNLKN